MLFSKGGASQQLLILAGDSHTAVMSRAHHELVTSGEGSCRIIPAIVHEHTDGVARLDGGNSDAWVKAHHTYKQKTVKAPATLQSARIRLQPEASSSAPRLTRY